MAVQIPIPDQLAAVRGKIAALQEEEKQLRQVLINDASARDGADYVAIVKTRVSHRVAAEAVRKANPALFSAIATKVTADYVFLIEKDEPC